MFGFPAPASLPCPEWGVSIALDGEGHECDEERRRWYQLFLVTGEIAALEDELREYLSSREGRFEAYCAERERLLSPA